VTGPANIISYLIQDLGRPDLSGWVLQAPVISQAALAPFLGRLSDEVGRKWIVTLMPLFGVVGAAVCSRANSMNTLIAGATLIGMATAPVGINVAIPSEILPANKRAYAQATIQIAGSVSGAVAALGSGAMVQAAGSEGWRNFYYMVLGLFASSSIGTCTLYNPAPRPGSLKSWKQILHECDPIGSVLITGAVTMIIVSLNYGSARGFASPFFYGPFVGGMVLVGLAVWYEGFIRNDGIFHHDLFKEAPRNFVIAILCFFFEGWLYFSGVAVYFPQQTRYLGWETSALLIGCRKFLFSASNTVLIIPIIFIITKYKDVKWLLTFAYAAFLVSMCLFATSGVGSGAASLGYIVIASFGMCPQLMALNIVIQCTAPAALIATASALALTVRGCGGAFGSAVMGSQVSQRMTKNLARNIVPVALANGLPASSSGALVAAFRAANPIAISKIPGITPTIIALITPITRETYAAAFRIAWITVIPASVLGLLAILLLDNSKVKARLNNTIDATVETAAVEEMIKKEHQGDKLEKEGLRV